MKTPAENENKLIELVILLYEALKRVKHLFL